MFVVCLSCQKKKVTLLLFIGGDYDLAIQGTILIYNSGKYILAGVTKNTLRHLHMRNVIL